MLGLTGSEVCQLVRKAGLQVYILMFTEGKEANNLIEVNEPSSTPQVRASGSLSSLAILVAMCLAGGQRRCELQNSVHTAT
jgi:hypothetical protein